MLGTNNLIHCSERESLVHFNLTNFNNFLENSEIEVFYLRSYILVSLKCLIGWAQIIYNSAKDLSIQKVNKLLILPATPRK